MPIKTTATTLLNQNSKELILLNNLPPPENENARSQAKITTGMTAKTAKTSPNRNESQTQIEVRFLKY